MEFDNAFEVPLPPAQAWPVLMDIRGIAPCMPGAQLTEVVDAETYKGQIAVRLGPVALTFAGVVKFEEIDHANHRARLRAQGTDAKGRGSAQAAATTPPAGATTMPAARPISGFALLWTVLINAIRRLFGAPPR